MLTAFTVRNLRAIVDSGRINLAKINIIVGKNSAGKSTLLRVLPLLKQSVEKTSKGPILWYGRLVDFGSFRNAVNASNESDGITFGFEMDLRSDFKKSKMRDARLVFGSSESARTFGDIPSVSLSLTLGLSDNDDVGKVRHAKLDLGSDQVEISFNATSNISDIKINSVSVKLPVGREWFVQPGKIVPILIVLKEEDYTAADGKRSVKYLVRETRPFHTELTASVAKLFHGNTSPETISEFSSGLLYGNQRSFLAQLKNGGSISSTFEQKLESAGESYIDSIRRLVLLSNLSSLLRRVDEELSSFAEGVTYVEPVRATAERYYRLQDLSVEEIDSRGENAAMFISSLNNFEQNKLEVWMQEKFGFHAYVTRDVGHVQVKISSILSKEKKGNNIADLGFGYSQLLPIILQLWHSLVRQQGSSRKARNVVAIEQPELHLHPQFQAQIADVISSISSAKNVDEESCIVIETHSEHIVNRFGQLISRGKLSPDSIQVLVVEDIDGKSTVRKVEFNSNGYLTEGWPVGFFVPGI